MAPNRQSRHNGVRNRRTWVPERYLNKVKDPKSAPFETISLVGGVPDPRNGLAKRVIALWLASKLLRTIDAVRLALDSLGTVGSASG
jgi:hypothetical protein